MRHSTFWESAGRPLFVRSVWLGTEKTARAPQRHFLLDYEAQKKLQQRRQSYTNCDNGYLRPKKGKRQFNNIFQYFKSFFAERLQQAFSYEHSENVQARQYRADCLAIATRKLNLQPALSAAQTAKPKAKRVGPRRLTKLNLAKLEPHSAHGTRSRFSATSVPNCLETPVISKRLAERVLNWLDLAVKGMSTELAQFELDIEDNGSPSAQRCSTAKVAANKPCAYTRWKKQEKTRQKAKKTNTAIQEHAQQQANVKRVSIVFEHARTQLKKLPILEANMQKSADFRRLLRPLHFLETKTEANNCVEKPAKSNLLPHEFLHDNRKQLHIFMPSLPNKPSTVELCVPSMFVDVASTVDSASALSFNESEF